MLIKKNVKQSRRNELPFIPRKSDTVKGVVKTTLKEKLASKEQTQDNLKILVEESRKNKIELDKKWQKYKLEQNQEWEKNRIEQNKRWEKYELEQDKNRLHQQKTDKKFSKVHNEIMEMNKKYNRQIGALGSRWGLQSERTFRDALAGILEKTFNVKVLNINDFDEEGVVFGHPDQIEMDIIVQNGMLIICELKSSMSKSDLYTFERKINFYEKKYNKKATRKIVISPMIAYNAHGVAKKLNLEIYSDSLDVKE